MTKPLSTKAPFSFHQTLAFIDRFMAIRDDYARDGDALTAAVVVDGESHWFTLAGDTRVGFASSGHPQLRAIAEDFVGAHDDLAPFYAIAERDPAFAPILDELRGLHHVRFLTLPEIAVYCVMMQRNPIARAAALKKKFLAAFGRAVTTPAGTLRAMPEFADLVRLDGAQIGRAINHPLKGEQIAKVVRGVAALGREFLATAPYDVAQAALVAIPGIGPFSAGAILLRGLGRMDQLPSEAIVADEARAVYGPDYDHAATVERYGRTIGYWSFYLKTGVARRPADRRPARRAA